MSTTPPPVAERESALASTDIIIASLAVVITLILLLLVTGGIVLAIIKVLRKRHIKEVTRVKYISGEGGYVETEDGSGVDGGFDNRVVSFNFSLFMFPMIFLFHFSTPTAAVVTQSMTRLILLIIMWIAKDWRAPHNQNHRRADQMISGIVWCVY
jgi:hypothetical protein